MIAKLLLCTFLLGAFDDHVTNYSTKKITVVGIARNVKGAAMVMTDDKDGYFVNGLDKWDDKYYGKKVKVTGKLIIVTHTKESTYPGEFQEWVGPRKLIKKPKWSLVE